MRAVIGLAVTIGIVLSTLTSAPAAAAHSPTLAISVNSFERDLRTGRVSVEMDITGSGILVSNTVDNYGSICRSSYCNLEVVANGPFGTTTLHSLDIQNYPRDAVGTLDLDLAFESTLAPAQVTSLRVSIKNLLYTSPGGISSASVTVQDDYPKPYLSAAVHTFLRSNDGTKIAWDLTIMARHHQWAGSECGGNCTLRLEGRLKGTTTAVGINGSSIGGNSGPLPISTRLSGEHPISGGAAGAGLDAIRVVADPYSVLSSNTYGAWIPVSMEISGGYDVGESVSALVLALAGSPAPCIELFPVGTHTNPSSLNDQQLECTAALQSGKSLGAFIVEFIGINGASKLATMFVGAGLAQNADAISRYPWLNSESETDEILQNPPEGMTCLRVPILSISCTTAAQPPEVIRLPSAPPPSNPTWERNQIEKIRQADPRPKLPPIPAPGAEPGPWTGASEDDYIRTILRQCQKLIVLAPEAGLPEDACSEMPIFATGGDARQATDHDLEAITSNPAWQMLTYASAAEKIAGGFSRPWWSPTDPCATGPAGNSCDEFPYFATEQGGLNGQSAVVPSLKSISSSDNSRQGGHYGNFATKKCKLQLSPPGTPQRNFLVVPVPYLPTSYWCGD